MITPQVQNEINQLVQQGLADLNQNRPAKARDAFNAVLEKGGANASLWLAMAYAQRDLKETKAMMEAVDKSIALERHNPRGFILKAEHYIAIGDKRAAAAFYSFAVKSTPPPEHTPDDLKEMLKQAQEKHKALTLEFQNYLEGEIAKNINGEDEDTSRITKSLDLLTGKKKLYEQKPHQYYFPDLPNIEFSDAEDFSWVPQLESETDVIRQELEGVLGQRTSFDPYVTSSSDRPHTDQHGMVNDKNWGAFYLWKNGALVEENAALCPKTVEIMKKIPLLFCGQRSPNVLFSILQPGAKIPPHTGMVNTRLICHLPIIIPENCGFRVGNDVRKWVEGKVWLFDDTILHEAWNNSDKIRTILLFEVWKPELSETERKLVTNIFEAIDSYGPA
jgi:aspartyl/asparaginyl beta-hydroxylase (cupin superfamily)